MKQEKSPPSIAQSAHEKRALLGSTDTKERTRNLQSQQRLARIQISRTACKALKCKRNGDLGDEQY